MLEIDILIGTDHLRDTQLLQRGLDRLRELQGHLGLGCGIRGLLRKIQLPYGCLECPILDPKFLNLFFIEGDGALGMIFDTVLYQRDLTRVDAC